MLLPAPLLIASLRVRTSPRTEATTFLGGPACATGWRPLAWPPGDASAHPVTAIITATRSNVQRGMAPPPDRGKLARRDRACQEPPSSGLRKDGPAPMGK